MQFSQLFADMQSSQLFVDMQSSQLFAAIIFLLTLGSAIFFASTGVTAGMEHEHEHGEGACEKDALTVVWNRHRRWSQAATKQRKTFQWFQTCHLSLIVAGAFSQTLAARLASSPTSYGWAISLTGGGCLGAAALISNNVLTKERQSNWVRCRATSEAVKAEVFLFRAGVPPYDDKAPDQILVLRVADISERAKDLKLLYIMTTNDETKPPPILDRDGYIKRRLDTQIENFYLKMARNRAKKSAVLKKCQYILAFGSSAVGLVAGSTGGIAGGGSAVFSHLASKVGIWGPAFATASAAFGTHIAAAKYDDEVMEWTNSAQLLENLYLRLPKVTGPGSPEWNEFVLKCEAVISSNTNQWASPKAV